MARSSKKKEDRIRLLKARAVQRERAASQPASPTGDSTFTSPDPPPDRDAFESRMVRAGWDQEGDGIRRFAVAHKSWLVADYERAAANFRELLQQESADPWFVRYWLASCLFQLESRDELAELLHRHDDNSGIWRFAQALHMFCQHGDTEDARGLLMEAHRLEPGFEQYLLQDELVDARREVWFDAGSGERASGCARLFLPAWRNVPGATAWARKVLKVPPIGADRNSVARRFPRQELCSLPLRREMWQVGLRPCRDRPADEDSPIWLFGVASIDRSEIRLATVIDQQLTEVVAWNELMESFLSPIDGHPARPSTLVVCRRDFRDAWKPWLAQIGVRCRYERDPQPLGQLLEAMDGVIQEHEAPRAADVDIREFTQSDAIWQTDFFRSPAWVMNEREGAYRPWSVLVLEKSKSSALMTSHTPGDPEPEMLLEALVRTMARPGGQAAQRPRLIEVSDSDCYDYVRPRLEAAGVACRLVDEMREFNEFCLCLARSFDGSEKCALADGCGVTRAHMESFYGAAEYYFRQRPWRRVPGEVPIEIRCDDPAMGTRYAIVLGRTGVQLGLCVHDDWQITQATLSGYATPDANRALAVCYDESQILAAVDLQLIERLGWPIAAPEAWPAVMRLQAHRIPRSPNADELAFLDACLRAIPDFLTGKAPAQTRKVETGTRCVELHLAWRRL